MGLNYPAGVTDKDFDPPKMTEWEPICCEKCGEVKPLDDDLKCADCFKPQEIDYE